MRKKKIGIKTTVRHERKSMTIVMNKYLTIAFLLIFLVGVTEASDNWEDEVSSDITFENGVYKIYCPEELSLMSQWINSECSADQTYELMNDIDLQGKYFKPIGQASSQKGFKGKFDGKKFVVRNLNALDYPDGRAGDRRLLRSNLFDLIEKKAVVENVVIESDYRFIDLVIENYGNIKECLIIRVGQKDAEMDRTGHYITDRIAMRNSGNICQCYIYDSINKLINVIEDSYNNIWQGIIASDITFEDGVYKIYSPEEFALMAQWINAECSADQTYELMNDIDLGYQPWTPIGKIKLPIYYNEQISFKGTFEGNHFAIRHLNIRWNSRSHRSGGGALWGFVAKGATIKNLILEDFEVYAANPSSVFVAVNYGTITQCLIKIAERGIIHLSARLMPDFGVFACLNFGIIEKCYIYAEQNVPKTAYHGKTGIITGRGDADFVGRNFGRMIE